MEHSYEILGIGIEFWRFAGACIAMLVVIWALLPDLPTEDDEQEHLRMK